MKHLHDIPLARTPSPLVADAYKSKLCTNVLTFDLDFLAVLIFHDGQSWI
jgi:hypothetical protein